MSELWSLALQAAQAMGAHIMPAMVQAGRDAGIEGRQWFGWLLAAESFEPEPMNVARLCVRGAYTAPELFAERLAEGVRLELLAEAPGGGYRLTERGREVSHRLMDAAYAVMAALAPLTLPDLERLAGLLRRLVEATLAAPQPPGQWCLRLSRRTDPGANASVVARIDQYVSDLAGYRDDVHLAAWQPYGVDGREWDALSAVWREGPLTPEDVHARLERRGYTREAYAAALRDLAVRGWVAEQAGRYRITDKGRALRETAESTTDRTFYAPWACLTAAEVEELRVLLQRLADAVPPPPE